ncbi:unnamed protein product [Rangifer tarandus platyrhynchus]|uniref:Uncharacterized protein n=2 Tax=Rangifer tarandus platyrhynchus TaxID=3082113 RepID=A0ABN8YVL5_RANTA|nr:unnamed protein product [Rangifer tarandus platyrhynchus]CAI9700364.1 unnamed protein product [Rangifer tarandus platyrhynchus]
MTGRPPPPGTWLRASAPSRLLRLQALLASGLAQGRGGLRPSCLFASLRGPWLPPFPSSRSEELKLEIGFASACTIFTTNSTQAKCEPLDPPYK